MWKVCDYERKKDKLSEHCFGAIGTFAKGVLRTIDNDKYFLSSETEDVEGKTLSEHATQPIKKNEDAAATNVPVKDKIMAEAWIIEDDCGINRHKS